MRETSEIHPDVALIAYNLACYSCVLGDLVEARTLLNIAFSMDVMLKQVALDDSDLAPFFGENSSEATPLFVPRHLPEFDSP